MFLVTLSPAKAMNESHDGHYQKFLASPLAQALFSQTAGSENADFLSTTQHLVRAFQHLSVHALGELLDVSPALAQLNHQRYQRFLLEQPKQSSPFSPLINTENNSKAAIFMFNGDAYKSLDINSLSNLSSLNSSNGQEIAFLQKHLRIFSGLYGVLQPLQCIQPYRLDMGTRLHGLQALQALQPWAHTQLYSLWQPLITEYMLTYFKHANTQAYWINLASKEYAQVVDTQALQQRGNVECIHVHFLQKKSTGQYASIGIHNKKARGLMVRHLAMTFANQQDLQTDSHSHSHSHSPHHIIDVLQAFDLDGYRHAPQRTTTDKLGTHHFFTQH